MNHTFDANPNFNFIFSGAAMNNPEFWKNFKPLTQEMEMPVLFFYGSRDWRIGPEHYKGVNFPKLMLWESEVGHIPFLEAKENLAKAIVAYL